MSLPKPYYQDDAVTIYNADCRDILPDLPKVDLVLTDPPYSHEHMDGGGFAAAREFYAGGKIKDISNFELSYFVEGLFAHNSLVAFTSRDLVPDYAMETRRRGWKFDLHIWHKTNAIPFCHNTWKSDIEYIILAWQGKKDMLTGEAQDKYSKVFTSGINTESLHPTQKPVPLMSKYIRILQPQIILDPFLGSGTTAFAAKKLGRKCIGIEIEEKYCEIAAKRCSQSVMNLNLSDKDKEINDSR